MALAQVVGPVPTAMTIPTQTAGGRLTLDSANAVSTTDQTAKTTIYYLPYAGRGLSLWNSTLQAWRVLAIPDAGASVALGTLGSAAAPYDVFAFDNNGSVAIEIGPIWTNTTTRATTITIQDGTLCKNGDKTRRYLGTFMPTATTTTEDSASNRYLWNYYNRVTRRLVGTGDPGINYTYTTATWRASNTNTTVGQCRVQAVIGMSEDPVLGVTQVAVTNTGTAIAGSGIGIDSTSANSCQVFGGYCGVGSSADQLLGFYRGHPGIGQHYFQQLEISQAAGTTTWLATSSANGYQKGFVVEVLG